VAQIPDGLVHDLCEPDRIFISRPIPIPHDARLRECDYGNFEGSPRTEQELPRAGAIRVPFPHGESYEQVTVRRRIFLEELAAERDGQQVLLIRHHATLWMLYHWLRDGPMEAAVGMFPERPWGFAFEPQQ
jgi:broad specificity phosphatase PhoE